MGGGETLRTGVIERMMQEAETWQQLDGHDHIVGVVDYGNTPLPWIGMEYMDAGHLGQRAKEMPLEQALWTAIATTEAVRHAHRRGVAHLDLKPENILLRSVENRWDAPKVADWGLSKHLLEHSKSVEGMSPQYAAPEQFDDEYGSTDDITDVYQLGAVFYELFTGRPPFEGQTFKVINKIQTETPTSPSEIADVPPALDEILLTALETQKADRHESVLYLRDDLQDLRESL
jgi:Serine/threonine protein kinase